MTYRKKLIEVSLPLEAINKQAVRENYIYKGNPSSIHKWWSGKPLSVSRAVLFAQIVDDPSEYISDEKKANEERERLFDLIRNLVVWENNTNEEILSAARIEIARSIARGLKIDVPVGKDAIKEFIKKNAPIVLDPFAGGGSIPLEAQRLGLRAYANDLNPVAVLINKALIEIPPKFSNLLPVHPEVSDNRLVENMKKGKGKKTRQVELWQHKWIGAQGLAEDIRYYGKWLRDEAFGRIGSLYPRLKISADILSHRPDLRDLGLKNGEELEIIAWLWVRTVTCPNPACGAEMPLLNSYWLSTNAKHKTWLLPVIDKSSSRPKVDFKIMTGSGDIPDSPKLGRGAKFKCIACEQVPSEAYIKSEFLAKRNSTKLRSIVVDGRFGRLYLPSILEHEEIANNVTPSWRPNIEIKANPRHMTPPSYGVTTYDGLFTERQLTVLNVFVDCIDVIREKILDDIRVFNKSNQNRLSENTAKDYADAIATYLTFACNKYAMYGCSFVPWYTKEDRPSMLFSRQAIGMAWDFTEINPFSDIGGGFEKSVELIADSISDLPEMEPGMVNLANVITAELPENALISTDPPYFDSVPYADLSDFFYIWLRRSLSKIYPNLFQTILVPKTDEIVVDPYRHNGSSEAEQHFLDGIQKSFERLRLSSNMDYPITVYYAFKQTETETDVNDSEGVSYSTSTGWETMLTGLLKAGFVITGTWPIQTERQGRVRDTGSNALANSIVLVCRAKPENALPTARREFLTILKKELAPALRELQQSNIAPVDLAQAAIGPGMSVFSRYSAVLEADGNPMPVRTALGLINQALDEFLAEQEGEYDSDTRWALTWFEQFGHNEAAYGIAETLSKAKNTAVGGLQEAGILEARAGKVRLIRRDELKTDWDPTQDKRLTAWESAAHLIYALENGGEESAAELLAKLGPVAEVARDLAYRLYTVCERKGWSQDALGYNMLVVAWPRLKELAAQQKPKQVNLL